MPALIDERLMDVFREQAGGSSEDLRFLILAFCDLHGAPVPRLPSTSLPEFLTMQERAILIETCERLGWNVTSAARELGMKRTTLTARLAVLDIQMPPARRGRPPIVLAARSL